MFRNHSRSINNDTREDIMIDLIMVSNIVFVGRQLMIGNNGIDLLVNAASWSCVWIMK